MRKIIDQRTPSNFPLLKGVLFTFAIAGCISVAQPTAIAADGTTAVDSESRQFDFWLGDWAISNPNGSGEAASRVYLALGQYPAR
jgi:hypothetical protein